MNVVFSEIEKQRVIYKLVNTFLIKINGFLKNIFDYIPLILNEINYS